MKRNILNAATTVFVCGIAGLAVQAGVFLLCAIAGMIVDIFVNIPVLANAHLVGNYAGAFAFLAALFYFYYGNRAAV